MTWFRRVRIVYQAFFLVLFVWLAVRALAGDPRDLPFAAFHHADPLAMVGVGLAARRLPAALAWALAIVALTVVFGRVFCGWICPLGTVQELASRLLAPRSRRESREANRWRPWYRSKYLVLAFLLAAAAMGSLQTGLLDPLSALARGIGALAAVAPGRGPVPGGWLAAGFLLAIVLASRWIPRVFCRALCPLGALLGVFARLALFRIHRSGDACSTCTLCTFACQGADEPLGEHRVGECMVCLECVDPCPEGAIAYRFLPPLPERVPVDVGRRRVVGSVLLGLIAAPILEATGGGRTALRAELIRPPGSLPEPEFLKRCVKCSLCQLVCPTGVIRPAVGEAGVEGFWTPRLDMRRGWCEYACTRCGEVCPTGAIERLEPARKLGLDGGQPVRIGTAFIDRGRCLPWAMATPCIVCEEMCPTSPKAIWLEEVEVPTHGGRRVRVRRPHVDPGRCVGCGICEHRCPVGERAAIRVSSVGETRDPLNRMLLGPAERG